ncbi:hypothetical protein FRC04_002032 [Tulasnella sp. 424]|nr:hypothetical protein FRC04_002032 [Tulasnella sp. 424]KAG8968239.1 hypothetical protein FRC05_001620 [Tulasnella sp. 425]
MDLPNELLSRIVSFLTRGSIRNLMVNRILRQICERCLYRHISLFRQPRRSLRLFETFVQRPDLAQLVYHLSIDLSWAVKGLFPQREVPRSLKPDGMVALSLAKNVRSYSDSGVSGWIWEPSRARFRNTISKLKLVRLEIPRLHDPNIRGCCGQLPRGWNWRGDLGVEIKKFIQSQPLLEHLGFTDYSSITSTTVSSLEKHLQSSDIPSLKSLTAGPSLAAAFLPVASQLESLNLMPANWNDQLVLKIEASSERVMSIRRLNIPVLYYDNWSWSNLSRVLGLFPNTENLVVSIAATPSAKNANYYFDQVAQNVHVLPFLQDVEVRYTTAHPETPGIYDVDQKLLVDFKASCPLLENITTPKSEVWAFSQTLSGRETPRLIGRVDHRWNGPEKDLPSPYEDEESSSNASKRETPRLVRVNGRWRRAEKDLPSS